MRLAQRAAWLLAAPWRLVVLVAVVAALPIIVAGELAAADTTARHEAAAADTARRAASSTAASFGDRVSAVSRAVGNAATRANTGKATPLIDALDRNDEKAAQIELEEMHRFIDPAVTWLLVLDPRSRLIAVDPFATGFAGTDLSTRIAPARGSAAIEVGDAFAWNDDLTRNTSATGTGGRSGSAATSVAISVTAPIGTTQPLGYRLVAVVKLNALAGPLTSQLRTAYQDAYLVDRGGHLALRASRAFSPDDMAYRDLSGSPAVASLASGVADPLAPERVVRGVARATGLGWSVLVVDTPTAVDADLAAALGQQRALRVGLAGVLLLGAVLVGSASSTAIRRRRETAQALEQQTAIAGVLEAINKSRFDQQPVLQELVDRAATLCEAGYSSISLWDGSAYVTSAWSGRGIPDEFVRLMAEERRVPDRSTLIGRTALERRTIHITDVLKDADYSALPMQQAAGYRTLLGVPLLRDGFPIGIFALTRQEVRPFSQHQIQLIETFAQQAVIAIENVRLFNETKAALEQQTATSEVLRAMSGARDDVRPVLQTIAEAALRLCDADHAGFFRRQGNDAVLEVTVGEWHGATIGQPFPVGLGLAGSAFTEARTQHVPDTLAESLRVRFSSDDEWSRSRLAVPVIVDNAVIGVIRVGRAAAGGFTPRQIELVKSFAAQAAIAIENVRLFNETKEALDQQTAVGEVLKTISRSAFDLEPVLDIVLNNAVRLAGADIGWLSRVESEQFMTVAYSSGFPEHVRKELIRQRAQGHVAGPWVPVGARGGVMGFTLAEGRTVHVADLKEDENLKGSLVARLTKSRTVVGVPMIREGQSIGAMVLARYRVRPFGEREIELVQTFTDQAAIAIENVRLFNETKQALERQTAVSQVLGAISQSGFELKPVLETVIEHATKLCAAQQGFIYRKDGDVYRLAVAHGITAEFKAFTEANPLDPMGRGTVTGRVVQGRTTVHVPDVLSDPEYTYSEAQKLGNFRALLGVPMIRDDEVIGVMLLWRTEPQPFTDEQITLVTTFAQQATIAIENVRLFDETKEALEQQRAVAEVLKTISGSVFDLRPVLDTVVENAARLAGADVAWLAHMLSDEEYRVAAHYGAAFEDPDVAAEWLRLETRRVAASGSVMGRMLRERRMLHIADISTDAELLSKSRLIQATRSRTVLAIPMLRDGHSIGGVVVGRQTVRPFTEREIELVQTFADQAAIAIENVRLFDETKESLERQTAVSDVLQTISRSAFDLGSILKTVVENAARLCGADLAWMTRLEGDSYVHQPGALYARGPELHDAKEFLDRRGGGRAWPITVKSVMGAAYRAQRTICVDDIRVDPELSESGSALNTGSRSVIAVPVIVEGRMIGAIALSRVTVRPFTEREIQVVETFADQAAIAIQNVRLFNEIQDKSRELEVAGRHKSEFLANMSHELRTPLNAIIGFSEVLLQGIFGEVNEKQREYLQDVLGSGQHLLSLINDILDLSKIEAGRMELELSTFPVRAALESGMTIVRERAARHGIALSATVSDDVGTIEADERKVKQILYNLLSNAVKFTPDGGRVDINVRAENGDVRVEVRDTGIGVAAGDQERIFEEFRQVGRERSREGTGLGLTLTRRFVELHGGRIWLESSPGKGSTFGFTLPVRRAAAVSA